MNIITVILKSGVKMDISDAERIEKIAREESSLEYRGIDADGDVAWTPVFKKVVRNFLRVVKSGNSWEILEDEIAAFEYAESNSLEKEDIKI